MSILDHLTDDHVLHLDDRVWREIVRRIGHLPGEHVVAMLVRDDWTVAPHETTRPMADIVRSLDGIADAYADADHARDVAMGGGAR